MSAIEDLREQVNNLAEQLADAQRLWLIVSKRQDDVATLATATDRLSASTEGVDETLRTVGQAMQTARDAKTIAQDVQASQMPRDEIYEHLERGRKRNLRIALTALVLAVAAVVAGVIVATHIQNGDNSNRYRLCVARQKYDEANHRSVGDDVTYYRTQLDLYRTNRANTEALIRTFPQPQRHALRVEQHAGVDALRTALAAKERAFAAGVVGHCDALPH